MGKTGQKKQELQSTEVAAGTMWEGLCAQSWASRVESKGVTVRWKMGTRPAGTFGTCWRLWLLLWVQRATIRVFRAAEHAHAFKYSVSLSSRHNVVPSIGDRVVSVKMIFTLKEFTVYWRIWSLAPLKKGTWQAGSRSSWESIRWSKSLRCGQ